MPVQINPSYFNSSKKYGNCIEGLVLHESATHIALIIYIIAKYL